MEISNKKPFVGLAFKLEETQYGQLTWIRIYQGKVKKGTQIMNTSTGKKAKVSRMVRMHSADMEDVTPHKKRKMFTERGSVYEYQQQQLSA